MLHRLGWPQDQIVKARHIRQEFGLVPAWRESYEDFLIRVGETVNDRWNPRENTAYEPLIRSQLRTDTTDETRALTLKYIGVKTEPIDASEVGMLPAKGLALYDLDGSSLLCTIDCSVHIPDIIPGISEVVEQYRNGSLPSVDDPSHQSVMNYIGGNDTLEDRLFFWTFHGIRATEELLKLHEGVHGIHLNNTFIGRREGTRETRNIPYETTRQRVKSRLGRLQETLLRTTRAIDSELFAWSVSVDSIMQDVLTQGGLELTDPVRPYLSDCVMRLSQNHIAQHYIPQLVGSIHRTAQDAILNLEMARGDLAQGNLQMAWKHFLDGSEHASYSLLSRASQFYLSTVSSSFHCVKKVGGSYSNAFIACLGIPLSVVSLDVRRGLHKAYDYELNT